MIFDLKLPAASVGEPVAESPSLAFHACVAAKNRLLVILSAAFLVYYFALIVGAGWFRPLLTVQIVGGANVGTLFALSQYVFGAGLALCYARRMKQIDVQIKSLATARNL